MIGPPCQHSPLKPGCHLCNLYETHPGYRKLWNSPRKITPPTPTPAKIPLNCFNLGEELTAAATAALGLDTRRRWLMCQKGHGPQCGCKNPQTCGLGLCPDYVQLAPMTS